MHIIKIHESDLSSRRKASLIREEIIDYIDIEDIVLLDLQEVKMMTVGFADEMIGVLFEHKDIDFLINKIKIKDADKFVKRNIGIAISRRMGE